MSISITSQTPGYLLETTQRIAGPRARLFDFFSDARNLERITPSSLRFRIVTPTPIDMKEGTLIDYRLRIRGVPVRWRSEITAWAPPHRFVDEQRRGPYLWWRHEHLLLEEGTGTLVKDRVSYGVIGGRMVHGLFVARELRRIFAYRQDCLDRLFNRVPPRGPADPEVGQAGDVRHAPAALGRREGTWPRFRLRSKTTPQS